MQLTRLINSLKSSSTEKYECHINIMKIQFIMLGLWKSSDLREINHKIVLAIVANLTTSCICILFALHHSIVNVDIQGMTEALLFFILFGRVILNYFWLLLRISSMNRLIEAAENNYGDFEEKSIACKTGLKAKCDSWNLLFFKSLIWMFCILQLFYAVATRFYLPNSTEKRYMFPFRTPWNLEETGNVYYYLVFFNQFATCAFGSALGTLDVTFSVMSINILSAEVDILGEACKQTKSYDQLRRNVQQHVLLISLMNDVQSILSFIVLDMFVTCEFILCLCSFQIYQIYSTTSFFSLMQNICLLTALTVHEFVYFFFGQRLVSKTQDLHRSVYFCEWYNETKSFKNSMNIVHLRMNKPFTILAGKIIPVTLASFITCLKAAFSYFNLLRALSHT